ncbi:alpha/beta fold hydrolase, partial [Leucobacter sp. M11]|uniref:alpha/beta fold hydrolase n=1 Tax=Leucobacter sp. M11 TaxID=2993565 RepID=UPI002D806B11
MTEPATPPETRAPADPAGLPGDFDPLGPSVGRWLAPSGRELAFLDDGEPGGIPLVLFGGAGTSVRAARLLEFARSLRLALGVRLLSVERNGLGQSAYDPAAGFDEHAADVWALLDRLGISRPSLVAISGGGPYAARLAAARPERIRSMHLACAITDLSQPGTSPALPASFDLDAISRDPTQWWAFPEDSPVHRIPGFADSVIEEALRGRFARGRDTPPEGLAQAIRLLREAPLPELSAVRAPVHTSWGLADRLVPVAHRDRWLAALPGPATQRDYPGEGHDVQYRHWDQILADVATLGGGTLLSRAGRTFLVP